MIFQKRTQIRYSIFFLFLVFSGYSICLQGFPTWLSSPNVNLSTIPQNSGILASNPNVIDEISLLSTPNQPTQGILNSSAYHIFWFIQITDTQMAWYQWGKPERRNIMDGRNARIRTFFNTTQKVLSPLFIVNTGDLIDSSYESYFRRTVGQRADEWAYYNESISETGVNSSYYFDMVGNHDIYRSPGYTHYLNYSFSGSAFHTDQYMISLNLSWGNYQFYALSTPEDYGLEFPFSLYGSLSQDELNWFESKLQTNSPSSNLSFAFGHHPIAETRSAKTDAGNSFSNLVDQYGVDSYLYGHGHKNEQVYYDSLTAFETAKLDDGNGNYRIMAVDNDGISTSLQKGDEWPAGIITAPIDVGLAHGDYDAQESHPNKEIRTLAWDPKGIATVEYRIDSDSTWHIINSLEGPLYQGIYSESLDDGQMHQINVRITNVENKSVIKTIQYCSNEVIVHEWSDYWLIYVIASVGIGSILVSSTIIRRRRNPEKYGKKPNRLVQKKPAKWLLWKFLVLLICPMTFGLMDAESFTAVFSLFLVSKNGIVFSDTIWLASGIFALVGFFQSLCLSEKGRIGLKFFTGLALLLDGLLFVFFITHYPTVSWISPGYYLLIWFDLHIIRYKSNKL